MAEAGVEIERKWLVAQCPEAVGAQPGEPIRQGYLADGRDGLEVRVRRRGDRAYLTVKQGAGRVRVEEEIEIEADRFERLWPLTEGARVEKHRHALELDDGAVAEVDVYAGALDGLVTVDVEFPDEDAAERFTPPDWFGPEVTDDPGYRNRRLATDGRPGGSG
jgi:adenylate cyclase